MTKEEFLIMVYLISRDHYFLERKEDLSKSIMPQDVIEIAKEIGISNEVISQMENQIMRQVDLDIFKCGTKEYENAIDSRDASYRFLRSKVDKIYKKRETRMPRKDKYLLETYKGG